MLHLKNIHRYIMYILKLQVYGKKDCLMRIKVGIIFIRKLYSRLILKGNYNTKIASFYIPQQVFHEILKLPVLFVCILYIFVTFNILSRWTFYHFRRFVFRHFATFDVFTLTFWHLTFCLARFCTCIIWTSRLTYIGEFCFGRKTPQKFEKTRNWPKLALMGLREIYRCV